MSGRLSIENARPAGEGDAAEPAGPEERDTKAAAECETKPATERDTKQAADIA